MNLDITVTIPDPLQGLIGYLVAAVIAAVCVALLLRLYAHPYNRAVWRLFSGDFQRLNRRLFTLPDLQPTTENQSILGWLAAAFYSVFSAYLCVYAALVTGLVFASAGVAGVKGIQASFFIAGLILLARVFQVEARRARVGLF
ncbi:MAG: hypothetical protein MI976_18615 [Pseudomonadales bacterium]|nr:hypothetical protein [Pseudomonadales bacterium]